MAHVPDDAAGEHIPGTGEAWHLARTGKEGEPQVAHP